MGKLDVLISGCGIAGPTLAYWLGQSEHEISVTIVERSESMRTSGQAIDIRNAGVEVIRRMGLEQAIRDHNTLEEGFRFVNEKGDRIADFPATGDTSRQSFTSEFEILRRDMANILHEASQKYATYVFGEYATSITELHDGSGKTRVEFANGKPTALYDLVVGADGQASKTRRMVFGGGPDGKAHLKVFGEYLAYCTIPYMEFGDKWARWYNATGGRVIFLRPDKGGATGAYIGVCDSDLSRFEEAQKKGNEALKQAFRKEFEGAGWLTDSVLDGMDKSDDFYGHLMAQVRMEEFVRGNVALLGDAGYCPSPMTGMGTTLAMTGAYVLASEVSNSVSDIPQALKNYQSKMKPIIKELQHVMPGAPHILIPQSRLGIWIMHFIMSILAVGWIRDLFYRISPATSEKSIQLPAYSRKQGR